MNKELLNWLTTTEQLALKYSSHPKIIAIWARQLAETRLKLAMARGMLYSVKGKDYTEEELDEVLERTGDE